VNNNFLMDIFKRWWNMMICWLLEWFSWSCKASTLQNIFYLSDYLVILLKIVIDKKRDLLLYKNKKHNVVVR